MDHLLSKEYIRDEFISMNSTGHPVVVSLLFEEGTHTPTIVVTRFLQFLTTIEPLKNGMHEKHPLLGVFDLSG